MTSCKHGSSNRLRINRLLHHIDDEQPFFCSGQCNIEQSRELFEIFQITFMTDRNLLNRRPLCIPERYPVFHAEIQTVISENGGTLIPEQILRRAPQEHNPILKSLGLMNRRHENDIIIAAMGHRFRRLLFLTRFHQVDEIAETLRLPIMPKRNLIQHCRDSSLPCNLSQFLRLFQNFRMQRFNSLCE